MPKMTDNQEDLRGDIEDGLAMFGRIHESLRVIEIRVRFLRERTNEQTNTGAIGEELASIRSALSIAQGIFEKRWIRGQEQRWPVKE